MRRLALLAVLASCAHRGWREPAPPPIAQARAQIAAARAELLVARVTDAIGAHGVAYAAAARGVDAMGLDYLRLRVKDDTGLHLLLAGELAKAGDVAAAAREAMASLQARIAQYAARYR